MIRTRVRADRSGEAQVYTRPSARSTLPSLRDAAAWYRTVPLSSAILGMVLGAAVVSAATHSLGGSAWQGLWVTGAVLTLAHVALRHPSAAATCAVLLGSVAFMPLSAAGYVTAAGTGDVAGALLALAFTGLLIALVAHRLRHGRPWVTTALALAAVLAGGPFLAAAVPGLGYLVAYLVAALVLFLRSGRVRWPRRRSGAARAPFGQPGSVLSALRALGPDYAIIAQPVDGIEGDSHLVVGPGGLSLVGEVTLRGVVREHPANGLVVDDTSLTPTIAALARHARALATHLRVADDDVLPVLVVSGARLPDPQIPVALIDADGQPLGRSLVVALPAVAQLVAGTEPVIGAADAAWLVKRARGIRVTPAAEPPGHTFATVLDPEGRPKPVTDEPVPVPLFKSTSVDTSVLVGQVVTAMTDQGSFGPLRVCGHPYADRDGIIVVPVCTPHAWEDGQGSAEGPQTFPFPLASLTAD